MKTVEEDKISRIACVPEEKENLWLHLNDVVYSYKLSPDHRPHQIQMAPDQKMTVDFVF